MKKPKFLKGKSYTENELYSIQDMITADQKKKAIKNALVDFGKMFIVGLVFTIIVILIGVHYGLFPNT